jgi:hypothetical protein
MLRLTCYLTQLPRPTLYTELSNNIHYEEYGHKCLGYLPHFSTYWRSGSYIRWFKVTSQTLPMSWNEELYLPLAPFPCV